MKVRHSDSLILVSRLAELEARQLKASFYEPASSAPFYSVVEHSFRHPVY